MLQGTVEQLELRIKILEEENSQLRRLQERGEYLLEIIDNTPAPIYLKDRAGKYLLVNREYERLAYTTLKEIAGKTDFDIFPEEIASLFRTQDEEVMRLNTSLEFEETITLADGEFTFITVKFPLHDAKGDINAVGGFCTDITDRKKNEEEKENLIARLQQALDEIKTLQGVIPICSFCKKIRDDKGYWDQLENYVTQHTGANFSHSFCPSCVKKHYPELKEDE